MNVTLATPVKTVVMLVCKQTPLNGYASIKRPSENTASNTFPKQRKLPMQFDERFSPCICHLIIYIICLLTSFTLQFQVATMVNESPKKSLSIRANTEGKRLFHVKKSNTKYVPVSNFSFRIVSFIEFEPALSKYNGYLLDVQRSDGARM